MTTRDPAERAARILTVEAEGILGLRAKLDANFARAVELLRET
jgi:hypothetical protein